MTESIHELPEERQSEQSINHSRSSSSKLQQIPFELANEVIENFNLKTNFFEDLAESEIINSQIAKPERSKFEF